MIELLAEANAAGAGYARACDVTCICLRTLKRWRREFKANGNGVDRRKGSSRKVAHRLSVEEGQRILLTCNEPKYADLADQGIYIGSERSFYRFYMPMASCTAAVERDYHKKQGRCRGLKQKTLSAINPPWR